MVKMKHGKDVDLSEQELVSCDRSSYGCSGGFLPFDYEMNPGVAAESEFPYKARDLACKKNLNHIEKLVSWKYVGTGNKKPSVEQIKEALYTKGPLWVVVCANSRFVNYQPGTVFSACSNCQSNHAVNLEGWDDEKGAWIMRNSWGSGWGNKGRMYIKYGCNRIAEIAAYAELP